MYVNKRGEERRGDITEEIKEEHAIEGRWNGRGRRGSEIHITYINAQFQCHRQILKQKQPWWHASSAASLLWPPRRANNPVLRFHSFVSLSPLESQYPLATHLFTFLPSFLPSSLSLLPTSSTSPSSHLSHRRPIDSHKETADMSEGRRQHEEHSISRKVDIEGPQRTNREAYINQTNTPCFPLPPLAPPIQRIPSSKPVWDVARRGDSWGISFPSFTNLIFIIIFLYLISFLFFSFLFFSFLFFSFLFFSFLFFSFLFFSFLFFSFLFFSFLFFSFLFFSFLFICFD